MLGGSERTACWLERAASALAVTLAVARPAFPSEDADQGSGLIVVALWGVVAVLWALAQMARGELRLFASPIDVLPLLLLAAVLLSVRPALTLRPAINMASEWAGLVLSFILVRQLFRDASNQRTIVTVMVATALALSVDGIYQTFWGLDATRAEYARNQDEVLRKLGIFPGTPQQETFENRLRSPEPFATFALANSLAAFLVAWLPLALSWLLGRLTADISSQNKERWISRLGLWLCGSGVVGSMLICLLLTQSRAGWVGFAVELVGLAVCYAVPLLQRSPTWQGGVKHIARGFLLVGLAIALVLYPAVRLGKLDKKNLTEAVKSLTYRWQYWQGAGRLIQDHFWAGVGPGNFKEHYLEYKLPESSEEIADPHNLVLEVWASSGVLAAVALLLTLGGGLGRLVTAQAGPDQPGAAVHWITLAGSGVAGLGLAAFLSGSAIHQYAGLLFPWLAATGAIAVGCPSRWLRPGVFGCAVAGVVVQLTASGGIGIPGVAQSLWILLALGQNLVEEHREPLRIRHPAVTTSTALAVVAGLATFSLWVLRPVTGCQAEISLGRVSLQQFDIANARRHFLAAAELDPLAAEPWMELARNYFDPWRNPTQRTNEADFEQAVRAMQRALRLAPQRLELHSDLGGMFAFRAMQTQRPQYWTGAIASYERCVALYPTSASLKARLADVLWQAGEHDRARLEMLRTLQLDDQTPHKDKKLDTRDRDLIRERLEPEKPVP